MGHLTAAFTMTMSLDYKLMKTNHSKRISQALKLLSEGGLNAALVVSSNPPACRSRDTHFPYRQNSDLFYFTGVLHDELTLILRPHARNKVTLIAPPSDPHKKLWEGEAQSVKPLARALGADLILSKDPCRKTLELLRGIDLVYLHSSPGSLGANLRHELDSINSTGARNMPTQIGLAERLTARLRCYKDSLEIAAIKRSAELTSAALSYAAEYIQPGMGERDIAVLLEYLYRLGGAEPAFNTIVASGRSAATLHYHALSKKLRKGELVLIDTGAELDMYASDISRTLPVGDVVAPELLDVYHAVRAAHAAAIKKVRPGARVSDIYRAAAVELTRGLKELGVLRGNVSQLVNKGAFKRWFPHSIGHSLGIDVHDPGTAADGRLTVLEPGMVITVEPGLYFSEKAGRAPPCGVRLEDDVLVTNRGCQVLTKDALSLDWV